MGYASLTTRAETVERALAEKTTFCSGICFPGHGVAEETFYKQTHDITTIDYLRVCAILTRTGTGTAYIKCYLDAVDKGTISSTGADTIGSLKIDCTALSGDAVIKLVTYGSVAETYIDVKHLCIYQEES